MRTMQQVIAAVDAGTDATDEELRYAINLLATWATLASGTLLVISGGKGSTKLSVPDHQRVRMAFDIRRKWDDMDMSDFRGGCFEPGIGKSERKARSDAGFREAMQAGAEVLAGDRGEEV